MLSASMFVTCVILTPLHTRKEPHRGRQKGLVFGLCFCFYAYSEHALWSGFMTVRHRHLILFSLQLLCYSS